MHHFLKKNSIILFSVLIFFLVFWFSLPNPLINDSESTVIYSTEGDLLGAMIAKDGQWRFPYNNTIPQKIEKSFIQFEDRSFYYHPGVNLLSILRATYYNIKQRKVVSGGSTITMQLIRTSRKGKSRNIFQKCIEMFLALRAEIRFSKKEILSLYISNAPFGGNVVGLDAASWRYFGRSSDKLSWAESATLAVLPNAPSLIFPGKNKHLLLKKRNRLLDKLYHAKEINESEWKLAKVEPLPDAPHPIPQLAPHLLARVYNSSLREKQIKTTIQSDLQKKIVEIASLHSKKLAANEIYNLAILVADVETGNVLAYVGNSTEEKNEHQNNVDCIIAPRSTGSILKPILYSAMLDDGQILPNTLISDIPITMSGFSPKNFNKTYDGVVPASRALSRSLNIPSVFLLRDYGIDRFQSLLKKAGMTTLTKSADHYGLSLILGGAEGTLWDISGIYASMARTLKHFHSNSGKYNISDFRTLNYLVQPKDSIQKKIYIEKGILNASSIWLCFKALLEVNRPEEETGWQWFRSASKVAWKTGTSFGFRDGWAIGTSGSYVVGVWVGNANGEGRPGLTGITCAAPVLFDVFDKLKSNQWFVTPWDELRRITVCRKSGQRNTDLCNEIDTVWVQEQGLNTMACKYHKLVHLDATGKYRVTSDCENPLQMKHLSWFVLNPVQEWYFKSKNPFYKTLPSYRKDCLSQLENTEMDFIYPKDESQLYIPVDLDGKPGKVVFEAAHRKPQTLIYWHLDEQFIGTTQGNHQKSISTSQGFHSVTLVDENGNYKIKNFEVK